MNNTVPIKATSLWIPTQIPLPVMLRWLRRSITILLVLANLALTLWATTAR